MLNDVIERVNQARKKAMQDPAFLKSAAEHEKAIKHDSEKGAVSKGPKSLAQIYSQANFGNTENASVH
jgi:hypothetical protein